MPMYENLKNYRLNKKFWSKVKIRAQNNYLYFTFLQEKDDPIYDGLNVCVDGCDHEVELTDDLVSYQIPLENIHKQNFKVHFSHREKIVYNPVLELELGTDADSLEIVEPRCQQDKLFQGSVANRHTQKSQWLQVNGLSYFKSKTKSLLWGVAMAPLFPLLCLNKCLGKPLLNFSSYTLFFGSYLVSGVLGADNKSEVLGSENIPEAYKNIPSISQERSQTWASSEDIFDFIFEKKKLIAIGVVSLCAAGIVISCAICNYGLLKLTQACSPKTKGLHCEELGLIRPNTQVQDDSFFREAVKSTNNKTHKMQKVHKSKKTHRKSKIHRV